MLLSILRPFSFLVIMALGFALIVATGDGDSSSPATPKPQPVEPGEPAPPQITIHEPKVSFFDVEDDIYFRGEAYDPETKSYLQGSQLIWTSNQDGQIGSGGSFRSDRLSAGTHEIILEARSKNGLTDSKTITLSINPYNNTRPTAEILSPANESYFHIDDTIIFSGKAEDDEDAMFHPKQLVWKSSRHEKELGTGFELQIQANTLAKGDHTISLRAWDSQGMPSEPYSISIHITKNHLPEVTIIFPTESSNEFTKDDYIIFEGKAWDREDGVLPCTSLKWYSDKHQDSFGNDCLVRSNIFSPNKHTITLVAKDSVGGKGTASTTITIITP